MTARTFTTVVATATLALLGFGFKNTHLPTGGTWPKGVVRISNEVRGEEEPFLAAVAAWNTSGARVRFRIVPSDANPDIVVRSGTSSSCDGLAAACAPVGFNTEGPGVVWVIQQLGAFDQVHVLVHELGHVLGLRHVRGCAAMDPGWTGCPSPPSGHWRCRLLEASDVSRVIGLYGGHARPLPTPSVCPVSEGLRAVQLPRTESVR